MKTLAVIILILTTAQSDNLYYSRCAKEIYHQEIMECLERASIIFVQENHQEKNKLKKEELELLKEQNKILLKLLKK